MIRDLEPLPDRDASETEAGWMGTPVPILQRRWEMATLLRLYDTHRPLRVLEIGTFYGGTLYHWLQCGQPGAIVVSVDSYAVGVDNRPLYGAWAAPEVSSIALCGDSRDGGIIADVTAFGPFDWITIDAGHYAHEVAADWAAYAPLCAPGGIIALHDIIPAAVDWIQVDQVWRQIQQAGEITQELIADPTAAWGGWGIVYR